MCIHICRVQFLFFFGFLFDSKSWLRSQQLLLALPVFQRGAIRGVGTQFEVFQRNLRLIEATQANDDSATYDHMGPFAATSQEDFSVRMGYRATTGAVQDPLLDVSSVGQL